MACLFFSFFSNAEIIKYDNYVTAKKSYGLSEVCRFLTKRESPLIDIKSSTKINCMGKVLKVVNFCHRKEAANPYFAKAYADKKSNKVICESSKKVILKLKCSKKNKEEFCQDKEIGCFLLKEKFAYRLRLSHSSLVDNALNCYFSIGESIN